MTGLAFLALLAAASVEPEWRAVLAAQGCAGAREQLLRAADAEEREVRWSARLELARCEEGRPREVLYREVVAARNAATNTSREEELAALTALNELAGMLIAENRAAEAAALYAATPPPRYETMGLSFLYSRAVTDAQAGNHAAALPALLEVIGREPLFASGARVLMSSLRDAPAPAAAEALPAAVRILATAGLDAYAQQALEIALERETLCTDGSAAVGDALVIYLADVAAARADVAKWVSRLERCPAQQPLARLLAGVYSEEPARYTTAIRSLRAMPGVAGTDAAALVRASAREDLRERRYAAAFGKLTAVLDFEPTQAGAAVDAAYILSMARSAGDLDAFEQRLATISSALPAEERAGAYQNLGRAYAAAGRSDEAARVLAHATDLYAAMGEKVPLLQVALVREEARSGSLELARAHVRTASSQCGDDWHCRSLAAKVGARLGVDVDAPAPSPGRTPVLAVMGMTALDAPAPVEIPFSRWDVDGTILAAAGGSVADAPRAETPVERPQLFSFNAGGPLLPGLLWGRGEYERDEMRRTIASIPGDNTLTRALGLLRLAPAAFSVDLTAEQRDRNETAVGASRSRTEQATGLRDDRTTSTRLRANGLANHRRAVEGSVELRNRRSDLRPRQDAVGVVTFERDGIRRGSSAIERSDDEVLAASVAADFRVTRRLSVRSGLQYEDAVFDSYQAASQLNAEIVSAEVAGAPFDVLRLHRSGTVTTTRMAQALWTQLRYGRKSWSSWFGLRFADDRGESASPGAPANGYLPELLGAIGPSRGREVRWRSLVPRVGVRFYDWYGSVVDIGWYRYAAQLPQSVIDFTNPARAAAVDIEHGAGAAVVLARYGTTPNVLAADRPEITDSLRLGLERVVLGGRFNAELAYNRVGRILGTRPLIADGNVVRPAVRADYVADGNAGFALSPRFSYTGAYLLENEGRGRNAYWSEMEWRRRGISIRAVLGDSLWNVSSRYAQTHDPTPLAAGTDYWGFESRNDDGAPAGPLEGSEAHALAVRNARWYVSVTLRHEEDLPLIGDVTFGGTAQAREGNALSPFVSVYGSDGVHRRVATARSERLDPVATLALFAAKEISVYGTPVRVQLECVYCLGGETETRRVIQQNFPRAGALEETLPGRTIQLRVTLDRKASRQEPSGRAEATPRSP